MTGRGVIARARRGAGAVAREVSTEIDRVRFSRRGAADVALFHEFAPPPTGGGHQFLRALVSELERRGLTVEVNRISAGTRACLFNSFNFDFRRLRRFARDDVRFVHRVDGPIATLSRLRRRDGRSDRGDQPGARRCDDRAVAVQPRRASRARDRARRSAVDLEHGRSVDLPSAGRARAARRTACPRHRDELVGQSEQGRRGPRLARRAPRPRALRADLRGSHRPRRSSTSASSARFRRSRRRGAAPQRRLPRAEPERSVLERVARGTRVRSAGGIPRERRPSRARRRGGRGVRRAGGGCPRPSTGSSRSWTSAGPRSASTPLAEVADRYLEVLRG